MLCNKNVKEKLLLTVVLNILSLVQEHCFSKYEHFNVF